MRCTRYMPGMVIDWAHPVLRDARIVYLPGIDKDFTRNRRVQYGATGIKRVGGPDGPALRFDATQSTSDAWFGTNDPLVGAQAFTWIVRFRLETLPNDVKFGGVWNGGGGSSILFEWYLDDSASVLIQRDSINTEHGLTGGTMTKYRDKKVHTLIVTWQSGRNFEAYVDGESLGAFNVSPFTGTITSSSSSTPFQLGTVSDGGRIDGEIYLAVLTRSYCPPAIARSVGRNPWQIFRQPPALLFDVPAPTVNEGIVLVGRASATQQPAGPASINRSNPITRGLSFSQVGATAFDVVRRSFATQLTARRASVPWGSAFSFDGSQNVEWPAPLSSGDMTISAMVYPTVPGGLDRTVFGLFRVTPGNHATNYLYLRDGQYKATTSDDSNWNEATAPTVAEAKATHVLVTYRAGGTRVLFVNGRQIVSGSDNRNPTGMTRLSIGQYISPDGTRNSGFVGFISDLCVWNRVLSPSEIADIARNPWQIFEAPSYLYAGSAAAAPPADVDVGRWSVLARVRRFIGV